MGSKIKAIQILQAAGYILLGDNDLRSSAVLYIIRLIPVTQN